MYILSVVTQRDVALWNFPAVDEESNNTHNIICVTNFEPFE
jgi:hypothetical protein